LSFNQRKYSRLKDGKRRRSPGGVFITLIKRDLTVLSEQKKKIFELKPEEKKMKKKRKRFTIQVPSWLQLHCNKKFRLKFPVCFYSKAHTKGSF
jgi:hypothetical protein